MQNRRPAYPPVGLVVLGIVVLALSLRGPIVAITPVLDEVAAELSIGASAAGLLGTLPVLAFAVASPLAALTIRRIGPEAATVLTFVGMFVSQLVRSIPTTVTVFAGTIALGLVITIGNIVVPVVIQRDVPMARVGAVTGVYTAVMNLGSLLTAATTAPLASALGWPLALASWSVLAVAGLAVWAVAARRRSASATPQVALPQPDPPPPKRSSAPGPHLTGRRPLLVPRPGSGPPGCCPPHSRRQAFTYYAYTTWLPTYLVDSAGLAATGAGALASTFQAWGIVGGLLVPALFRWIGLRGTAAAVGAMWLVLSVGLLLEPGLVAVWLVLGGIAQAGGFIVIFSAVALAARDSHETAGMSAIVQTMGYVVAATAGPVIGALHEASGVWGLPLGVLVATTAAFATLSLIAGFHVHSLTRRRRAH